MWCQRPTAKKGLDHNTFRSRLIANHDIADIAVHNTLLFHQYRYLTK
jgi:hypothetical protein